MNPENITEYLENRLPFYMDMLSQMVSINSFTQNPSGVNALGELTAQYFKDLGFLPEFVQSVNPKYGKHLFLQSPSHLASPKTTQNHSIAMISHLDTVFPPEEEKENNFFFRIEEDRIYGPGAVDIKGGTVLVYMVLDALQKFSRQRFDETKWFIGLDASEEALSTDFGALCLEKISTRSSACLIFEGGTLNSAGFPLVTNRKGRADFRVKAEGRGAHAGNFHQQGANAIIQLADTVQKIAEFTDYENQITFNVGVIRGGSVVNRVPHYADARVEMRAFSPKVFQNGIERVMALDGSSTTASFDGYPCRIRVEMISNNNPWPVNSRTESLYAIWAEAGSQLGMHIKPEARGGLSDGNLLWEHLPVLDGLGPSGTNAHCSERSVDGSKDQEFALRSSFVPKALLNIAAILRLVDQPV